LHFDQRPVQFDNVAGAQARNCFLIYVVAGTV
jgi:hypothetical protein